VEGRQHCLGSDRTVAKELWRGIDKLVPYSVDARPRARGRAGEVLEMETMEREIMTTEEVAQYLRLAEATVYKLAQSGEIPAVKVGRAWRFKRQLIDEWFREQAMSPLRPNTVAGVAD
jgi:excisionase family DNA binding protein